MRTEDYQLVHRAYAMDHLAAIEGDDLRVILFLHCGLLPHTPYFTLGQVGQILGLTPEAAKVLRARAVESVRRAYGD